MVNNPHVIGVLVSLVLFCICMGKRFMIFLSGLSVPRLNSVINQEMNRVELQSADSNKSLPSMCIQYEYNGRCQVSVNQGQIVVVGSHRVFLLFVYLSLNDTFRTFAQRGSSTQYAECPLYMFICYIIQQYYKLLYYYILYIIIL